MSSALYVLSAIAISCVLSCNNSNNEKNTQPEAQTTDTVFESPKNTKGDSGLSVKNNSLLWQIDDSGLKLLKPKVAGIDTVSAKHLVQLLNDNYDSIHLDFIKSSHDTIYVRIPHSETLTQRIGSTGAEIFMATATYSLTELKGIKYVNYDFEEGDHASPGVYTRDDFRAFQ